MAADEENKAWCSTLVDEEGNHVSGGGHYGDCGPKCPFPGKVKHFKSENMINSPSKNCRIFSRAKIHNNKLVFINVLKSERKSRSSSFSSNKLTHLHLAYALILPH